MSETKKSETERYRETVRKKERQRNRCRFFQIPSSSVTGWKEPRASSKPTKKETERNRERENQRDK